MQEKLERTSEQLSYAAESDFLHLDVEYIIDVLRGCSQAMDESSIYNDYFRTHSKDVPGNFRIKRETWEGTKKIWEWNIEATVLKSKFRCWHVVAQKSISEWDI